MLRRLKIMPRRHVPCVVGTLIMESPLVAIVSLHPVCTKWADGNSRSMFLHRSQAQPRRTLFNRQGFVQVFQAWFVVQRGSFELLVNSGTSTMPRILEIQSGFDVEAWGIYPSSVGQRFLLCPVVNVFFLQA